MFVLIVISLTAGTSNSIFVFFSKVVKDLMEGSREGSTSSGAQNDSAMDSEPVSEYYLVLFLTSHPTRH